MKNTFLYLKEMNIGFRNDIILDIVMFMRP